LSKFEDDLKQSMEQAILKMVKSGDLIQPSYESRVKIPETFIKEVWNMVDTEKIKIEMAINIEKVLADQITNRLASEIASDVKSVLSVKHRREAIRNIAKENLNRICNITEDW